MFCVTSLRISQIPISEQIVLQRELRRLRKQSGLSQVQLASLIHKPQSYVSKYENGERKLDILEVREICMALGVSLAVFAEQLDSVLKKQKE